MPLITPLIIALPLLFLKPIQLETPDSNFENLAQSEGLNSEKLGNYMSADEFVHDNPNTYEGVGIFDDCLGLSGYRDKEFFEAMVEDLGLVLEPTKNGNVSGDFYFPSHGFGGAVSDACYSKPLQKMIFLSVSADILQMTIVIEYDIKNRQAIVTFSDQSSITPPTQFGLRKGNLIELHGDGCPGYIYMGIELDEYTQENLKNVCHRTSYTYDLNKKSIDVIYNESYTPSKEELGAYIEGGKN